MMAKKKNEDELVVPTVNRTRNHIEKKYGEGNIVGGNFLLDEKKQVFRISPRIDMLTSGGIEEGNIVAIAGPPKWGKTTLALSVAAAGQREEYGERKVFYADIEQRLKAMNLQGITGLQLSEDRFEVIRSTKGKILLAEDYLNIMANIMKDEPNSILIIDSLGALCTENESSKEATGTARSDIHKMVSNWLKQNNPVARVNGVTVVVMQHLVANTSGYGESFVIAGGTKVSYMKDYQLRCTKLEPWTVTSQNTRIGNKITWKCECSALGAPGNVVESYHRFGYGLDTMMEAIEVGIDAGLVLVGGSWYTMSFMEEVDPNYVTENGCKFQGLENACQFLRDNPKFGTYLVNKIGELIA
jgi:RecA/RadA recombinase